MVQRILVDSNGLSCWSGCWWRDGNALLAYRPVFVGPDCRSFHLEFFFASHAFDMEFLPSGPHRGRSFDWTVSVPFNMNARFDQTVSTYPDIR